MTHQIASDDLPIEKLRAEYADILDRILEALINIHVEVSKMEDLEVCCKQIDLVEREKLEQLVFEGGRDALNLLAQYAKSNSSRYIERARKYIEEHCTDSLLSLELVAKDVGINATYLSRLFYEKCQVNFVTYVSQCRVDRARQLLTQSRIPVQEVGFRCGFNSHQNFNRVFKRYTGMTPGAYRKQAETVEKESAT